MKFIDRIVAAFRASSTVRGLTIPMSEPLEGRRLLSATTISAVNFSQLEYRFIHVGTHYIDERVYVPSMAAFSIGSNNAVYENTGSTTTSSDLGGIVTQISAGLTSSGLPEVYGLAPDFTVWTYVGGRWSSLGMGGISQVSASIDGTVYARAFNRDVWKYDGSTWMNLTGQATEISGGVDASGKPEVYATGYPVTRAFVNDGQGWGNGLGTPQFSDISGSINGELYGVVGGGSNKVMVWKNGTWNNVGTGEYESQVSAGLTSSGNPDVFAFGPGFGPPEGEAILDTGGNWAALGKTAIEIAAPAFGVAVAGNPVAIVAASGKTLIHNAAGFYTMPGTALDAIQIEYEDLGAAGGFGLPLNIESPVVGTNGRAQDFAGGSIFWSPATGAHDVASPVLVTYLNEGGPGGFLGFPTADPEGFPFGSSITYFQHGKIIDNKGVTTVVPYESSIYGRFNIYANDSVVGTAVLTVLQSGYYTLSYNIHDNDHVYSYDYVAAVTLISPTGNVFIFAHSYHITPNGTDNGTISGTDPRIATDWHDLAGSATNSWGITGNDTLSFDSWLIPDLRTQITNLNGVQGLLRNAYYCGGGAGDQQVV